MHSHYIYFLLIMCLKNEVFRKTSMTPKRGCVIRSYEAQEHFRPKRSKEAEKITFQSINLTVILLRIFFNFGVI